MFRRGPPHPSLFLAAVLASLIIGCVMLPDHQPDRHDAVGTVTVSSVLFTPLETEVRDSKRLSFGDYRSEENLIEAVQRPQIGITNLQLQALESALSVRKSGPSLQWNRNVSTSTDENGDLQREVTAERTRTFSSPEVPDSLPGQAAGLEGATARMLELFARSSTPFTLPPDQVATLVAAYKTYMVNLEEFYNVENVGFEDGFDAEFIPYKMHFTVTAEPGWYTQYYQTEAVVEMTLQDACPCADKVKQEHSNFRILLVSPPETAQTLDQMTASWSRVANALSTEASALDTALAAEVRQLSEQARRLEGLTSNKTSVVGFPAEDTLRIRFRPHRVPNSTESELQPTSRVLSAVVLIRRQACGTDAGQLAPGEVTAAELVEREARALARLAAVRVRIAELDEQLDASSAAIAGFSPSSEGVIDADGIQALIAGNRAVRSEQLALRDESLQEAVELEQQLVSLDEERQTVSSREARICTKSYFVPTSRSKKDELEPPRTWIWTVRAGTGRIDSHPVSHLYVTIPPWLGNARKPLRIEQVMGFYRAPFSDVEPARIELALATGDEERAAEENEKAEEALADAEKALEQATNKTTELTDAVSEAKTARSEAEHALQEARAAERQAALALARAVQQALGRGSVSLAFQLQGPRFYFDRSRLHGAVALVRVNGLPGGKSDLHRIPVGDLQTTLTIPNLDLGVAMTLDADGDPELRNLNAFLEVVLLKRATKTATGWDYNVDDVLQSVTERVVIQPWVQDTASQVASSQGSPSPAPNTSGNGTGSSTAPGNVLTLDLSAAEVRLQGEAANSPPTASSPGNTIGGSSGSSGDGSTGGS